MDASARKRWLRAALLVAVLYFLSGVALAELAGRAPTPQIQFAWRLTGWIVPAILFGAHLGYELARLRSSAVRTALHAASAVALGAAAVAAAGMIRALATGSGNPRLMAFAIALWPVVAGVPAFLVGLLVAAALGRALRGDPGANGS